MQTPTARTTPVAHAPSAMIHLADAMLSRFATDAPHAGAVHAPCAICRASGALIRRHAMAAGAALPYVSAIRPPVRYYYVR